jgi:hypothetical protein
MPKAPIGRALGWLGLVKARQPIAASDLRNAHEHATYFMESLILGISGAMIGQADLIEKGIHSTQAKHKPVWSLQGHLYRDFQNSLKTGLGPPGELLLKLLSRGDPN